MSQWEEEVIKAAFEKLPSLREYVSKYTNKKLLCYCLAGNTGIRADRIGEILDEIKKMV